MTRIHIHTQNLIQLIPISRLQVVHDCGCFIAILHFFHPITYRDRVLVRPICEHCSHFRLE